MNLEHNTQLAVTVGGEEPIDGVIHHPEDDGFTILFSDAPLGPDAPGGHQFTEDDPLLSTVCLHCLIDEHPEVGRGLDLAKQHGSATLNDAGEWEPD